MTGFIFETEDEVNERGFTYHNKEGYKPIVYRISNAGYLSRGRFLNIKEKNIYYDSDDPAAQYSYGHEVLNCIKSKFNTLLMKRKRGKRGKKLKYKILKYQAIIKEWDENLSDLDSLDLHPI